MMKTILVAEDEPFLRETIQLSLTEHPIRVIVAVNGEETIRKLDAEIPDLLLLDLLMPKRDGFAVLEYLAEHDFALPVIVLSNLSDEIDQEKCRVLGARDFLLKSDMDEDQLWPMVERYLFNGSEPR